MSEPWNGKDSWVEMFEAIGLDEGQMGAWHVEFERRFPDQHEEFLRWLGIDDAEVAAIRERFAE